jgi:hypothetical protein
LEAIILAKYNYKSLLEKDLNFQSWYDNIKNSSPSSADAKLRRIGYVCRVFNLTTQQIAKMNSQQGFSLIVKVIKKLDSEGKTGEYMKDYSKALKSWLGHNGTQITQKIGIPKTDVATKASEEQSPTPDQFGQVLDQANIKQKVDCTLVGFAGLRIETLGDYLGDDGLKVRDLPEIKINSKKKTVEFESIPTLVVVRKNLSKAGHQYFTFMQNQGCQYLKALLEIRMRAKETMTSESPIVVSLRYHDAMKNEHIRTSNVSDSIREPIRKAGFDWRPYILRSYFDTRMMMAEADGYIIKDWRQFWMGHKGDIEHTYTLNKGRLPRDLIEQMRKAFEKASTKYLATSMNRDAELTEDKITAQWHRQLLELAGLPLEEIDKLGDLGKFTSAEIGDLLSDKTKKSLGLNGATTQKVVPLNEVEKYIVEGWEYVRDLPPNKAIIRLPKH